MTWGILTQFVFLALALLLGQALAAEGVLNARATTRAGSFVAHIAGRTVALDLVSVYSGKMFYRVCVV